MSLAESVLEIAQEMEAIELQWGPANSVIKDYARQLCRVVKAAESSVPIQTHRTEPLLTAASELKRQLQRQAQQEEADLAQSLRLCVGGTLDGTCVPLGGAEVGKRVKAPTGEWYLLKEDGRFHLSKEGP